MQKVSGAIQAFAIQQLHQNFAFELCGMVVVDNAMLGSVSI